MDVAVPGSRAGLVVLVAAIVVAVPVVASTAALQASLTVSATTTVGDEPVSAIAHGAGQSAEIHLDYAGFGDGSHELTLQLVGSDNGDPVFLKVSHINVTGDAGEVSFVLDERFDLSASQTGMTFELDVLARNVGPDDAESAQATLTIDTVPATIYLEDLPSDHPTDEPVTIDYYGWGREALLDGIDLYADEPPMGADEQGEDTLLATATVEETGEPFYRGALPLDPEQVVDRAGPDVTLQLRPASGAADIPGSNLESIAFNNPPVAGIDPSTRSPVVGETVTFEAGASFDPDGVIETYRWDLDDDENFESSGRSVEWTYRLAGALTVTLVVVDDDGATAVATLPLEVVPAQVVTETTPGPPLPPIDPWVLLLGGGALLIGGLGVRYRGPLVRLAKRAVNRLRSDSEGEDDDDSNRPPTAVGGYLPPEPAVNRPVLFDGSLSVDPDPGDRVLSYDWTIDGREFDSRRVVQLFGEAGEYEVSLEVRDEHGHLGSWSEIVTVEAPAGDLVLDRIQPDSPGNDHENLDREYLVLKNAGDSPLDLSGWTVHDAAEEEGRVRPDEHTFEFDRAFELEAGATVAIHTGSRPEATDGWTDTAEERHVFWGKERAVWNNDEDVIVVEDGEGHPVLAVRYSRTDSGTYASEDLSEQPLLDWFPEFAATGVIDSSGRASAEVEVKVGSLSSAWDLVAGAVFRRGPATFLVSWGSVTGLLIASAAVGAVTGLDALVLPALLLPLTVLMVVIGLLWAGFRWLLATLRSWTGEQTESRS